MKAGYIHIGIAAVVAVVVGATGLAFGGSIKIAGVTATTVLSADATTHPEHIDAVADAITPAVENPDFDERVEQAARSLPQVLGRGSTANLSKGTTLARDLREQLAIEQAMSNPAAGAKLPLKMTDPRWPASEGWAKMQQVIQLGGGPINVHYLLNQTTGAIDDFKIVLPGSR